MISHENYGPCFKAAAWRWECDKVQNWRFSESTMARLGWILAAFQNGQWLDASSHVKICWTTSSWSNQLAQFHVDVYIAKLHVSCLFAFLPVTITNRRRPVRYKLWRWVDPAAKREQGANDRRRLLDLVCDSVCTGTLTRLLDIAGIQSGSWHVYTSSWCRIQWWPHLWFLPPTDLGEKQTRRDSIRPVGISRLLRCTVLFEGNDRFFWSKQASTWRTWWWWKRHIHILPKLIPGPKFLGRTWSGCFSRGRLGKQLWSIPLNVKWPLLEWHIWLFGGNSWVVVFFQDHLTISHPLFSEIPIAGRACNVLCMCFEDRASSISLLFGESAACYASLRS